MFLLNIFFYYLWEPTFFAMEVLLYGEFRVTDNSFAIYSYRCLRSGSRIKEVCRKLENKSTKIIFVFGPNPRESIKFTCTRNGRLSPMKLYRKYNPTQKRKCFQSFFHIITSICPLKHVCFLWLQYIQSYFKQ